MQNIGIEWKEDGTIQVTDNGTDYVIGTDQALLVNGEKVHHYPMDPAGTIRVKGE